MNNNVNISDLLSGILITSGGSTTPSRPPPGATSLFANSSKSTTQPSTTQTTAKQSEYVSKYDQMEEGRMSSKVIRTQLVKTAKQKQIEAKEENMDSLRLQRAGGGLHKRKAKKPTAYSESDDDNETSKVGLARKHQKISVLQQQNQALHLVSIAIDKKKQKHQENAQLKQSKKKASKTEEEEQQQPQNGDDQQSVEDNTKEVQ